MNGRAPVDRSEQQPAAPIEDAAELRGTVGSEGAEAYFRALEAAAEPTGELRLSLTRVAPKGEAGWLLTYTTPARRVVTVEVTLGDEKCVARGTYCGFSYRKTPGLSEEQRRWEVDTGLMLSRRLAKADAGAPPAIVLSPPKKPSTTGHPSTEIRLLGDCDRACRFCAWGAAKSGHERSLIQPAQATYLRVIDRLDGVLGVRRRRMESRLRALYREAPNTVIVWTGNDCLASPLFDHSLRFAYELGFRNMQVQGPGTRLADEETVDFLVRHSVVGYYVTMHGSTPETFAASGGKADAHALFWRALELLLARGVTVGVAVPCFSENVHELSGMLRELHARPVLITVFFWYPQMEHTYMFKKLAMRFEPAIAALTEAAAELDQGRVRVTGIPACVVPPELKGVYEWRYPGHHAEAISFVHEPACEGCPERAACPGFARVYSERFLR